MAKNSKISELERLRIRKDKLRAESEASLHALDEHLEYIQDHLGSLLVGTVTTSFKSKMPAIIQGLIFPERTVDNSPESEISKKQNFFSFAETVADQALEAIPFFFKGMKPVVIVFALRKIKELIFKKYK